MISFSIRGIDTSPTYGIGDFVVVIQDGIKCDRQGWSCLLLRH